MEGEGPSAGGAGAGAGLGRGARVDREADEQGLGNLIDDEQEGICVLP